MKEVDIYSIEQATDIIVIWEMTLSILVRFIHCNLCILSKTLESQLLRATGGYAQMHRF